ncbi:MAG TPA: hypothetical protein VFL87_03690 [Thermoleophilaceae bacterium]|nr:hypothetical protein [Thermoleophilaceae bacterium]
MGDNATVHAAPPQHLRALEQANRVRLARADLKRRIATQHASVVEVIADCPWQAEGMTISELLMSQRRWGRARCRRLLVALGIPENKQIGKLTERQSSALCAMLTLKYPASRPVQRVPAPAPVPAARDRAAELEPEPEFEAERSYELVGAAS